MLDRSPQWTEKDLNRLIAEQVQESVSLDYKAAGALGKQNNQRVEISKDVSALANSAGGILVYGMSEAGQLPTAIDPIDPHQFSREWLENVIIANIQPRIDDLHINPVALSGGMAGKCAYVVTVGQSFTAHQAGDKRYYKRYNFQSAPMEDYEVRDAMNRGRTPIIDVRIKCKRVAYNAEKNVAKYSLFIALENRGAVAAKRIKIIVGLPAHFQPSVGDLFDVRQNIAAGFDGDEYQQEEASATLMDKAIFPTDSLDLLSIGGVIGFEMNNDRFGYMSRVGAVVNWTAYADDMSPRQGAIRLADLVDF